MSGHIENEERYVRPGVFSIPVEPVILPCEECHGENYPNWRYDMIILSGVLCKRCLDREIENFRVTASQQEGPLDDTEWDRIRNTEDPSYDCN